MSLKTDLEKVKEQVAANEAQIVTTPPRTVPARSYPAPTQSGYTDELESPFGRTNNNFRAMWKVGETAIQQRKVITTALPTASSASGIAISPATTNANLVAVPDLTIPVNASGFQVQISWNISASLSLNTATASFAIFRDGVQIGQTQYANSPVNNQKFSASQTIVDKPSLGFHAYSVYWATTAGTLTADAKNRSVSGLVLRPQ